MFLKSMRNMMLFFVIALIGVVAISCSRNDRSKVVIKGSTTVLPIAQKAAEAFREKNKDIIISISGTGSGDGIKSIIEGQCDIANASRQMKDKEVKKAKDENLNIKEVTVAYDMIVPIVHPSNPVKNLSLKQLKGIYNGSITNWRQVGGKNETIVVVSRDTSSGTYEVWEKLVMKKEKVRSDALLQASNGAVVSVIAENPKALGYIGFGYVNDSIKPVNVNNIVGTLENGKSGKYPISRKLFMYINADTISKGAKAYIDFVTSAEGQQLVKEAGFIPL
jgi:phosphate transport system substrate-binding protein